MMIRKAKPKDAKAVAKLMMLAMKDIVYQFTGTNSEEKAMQFLEHLIGKKATQYSYENCWVVENNTKVIAVANVYNGAKLQQLRMPVAEAIQLLFGKEFHSEDETRSGEFYIDCVGVHPDYQGKGIGSKLFQFLIEEYVCKRNQTLGLLVDQDNPNARKLYLKLGFKIVGERTLAGKNMEHLQIAGKQSQLE